MESIGIDWNRINYSTVITTKEKYTTDLRLRLGLELNFFFLTSIAVCREK